MTDREMEEAGKPSARPWSRDDVRHLRILAGQKMSVLAIARKIGRSISSVQAKANRLGLRLPGGRGDEATEEK